MTTDGKSEGGTRATHGANPARTLRWVMYAMYECASFFQINLITVNACPFTRHQAPSYVAIHTKLAELEVFFLPLKRQPTKENLEGTIWLLRLLLDNNH